MASTYSQTLPQQEGIPPALDLLFVSLKNLSNKVDIGKSAAKVNIVMQVKEAGIKDAYDKVSAITQQGDGATGEDMSGGAAAEAPPVGLKSEEAESAFVTLAANTNTATLMLTTFNMTAGATVVAINSLVAPMQSVVGIYDFFKLQLTEIGINLLPVLDSSLQSVNVTLTTMFNLVNGIVSGITNMSNGLINGNPLIWQFNAAVLGGAMVIGAWISAVKEKVLWDSISVGVTKLWTIVQTGLNKAMLASPLSWIGTVLNVVVQLIQWAWNNFESFRKSIMGCWEVVWKFGSILVEAVISPIKNIISGLGSMGKAIALLFQGEFKAAASEAGKGALDLLKATPLGTRIEAGKNIVNTDWQGTFDKGSAAGTKSWENSQKEKAGTPDIPLDIPSFAAPYNNMEESRIMATGTNPMLAMSNGTNPMLAMNNGTNPMLTMPDSEATAMPLAGDYGQYAGGGKSISLQKFCDSIVIQIDKANDKGYNQIQQEIEAQLKNMLDEYEA